jgi:class 3 adenylate cyclase
MPVCPSCGQENPEIARFCLACGSALASEAAPAREERKVVTVLFCDLVGSTARAEGADPEDVRALLSAYHERVRRELERFGGTVEKFIGDAVMALFGAPVAHEDDPERAVRAALAIRDWATEEGDLQVRIGITTGEALVSLAARPEAGEGMASGDVVNTAARLQSGAAVNGILVDTSTERATERTIEYRPAEAVQAKGKAEPIRSWEAVRARARVEVERLGGAALVGRERELTLLRETLARVKGEREPQLVTLVGVPGIGKSRLVFELFQELEASPELVYWRHGRSLPYGDGVTFWALAEMVKAQAGILVSDTPRHAQEKLRRAVEAVIADAADAGWVERHLRPLAGVEVESGAGDQRSEAFAAWRRFLESLAEQRPLVLIFEDLHWADEVLLDFIVDLVDWSSGVPILVLCTARPELLTRRAAWGGGKVNSATLLLSPLSSDETARLVHRLLGRSALPADLQARVIERAAGNPLYTEEFVRMLVDRPEEIALPESVHGIIAARLDLLALDEKELLQDASVLGRVFWLGALGREPWMLEARLHALEQKEFVRRERRSSVAGETEYSFRHALVRDVAYEQIPRAMRAEKHRAAAEWIESLGRPDDHAEMLAYHYVAALDLARAAGQPTTAVEEAARRTLYEAGERAFALSAFAAAGRFYEEALALWPDELAGRAILQFQLARALTWVGDERRRRLLEDAHAALLTEDELERAAQADALLAEFWSHRGDRDRSFEHLERARELVAGLSPSPAKAHVLSQVARYRAIAEENDEALRMGHEAFAMAEELGLDEIRAHALNNIGLAKVNLGDLSGVGDLERSIEIALAVRSPEAARGYANLGALCWGLGEVRRAMSFIDEAVRVGDELGNSTVGGYARVLQIQHSFSRGEWDEALHRADAFLAACEAGETHYLEPNIRGERAQLRLARDDRDGAIKDLRRMVEAARRARDPQQLLPALALGARLHAALGQLDEARALADEALASASYHTASWAPAELAFAAEELGLHAALERWLEEVPAPSRWSDAARALLEGDAAAAAEIFHEMGALDDEAAARLRAAKRLAADGRRPEADDQLQRALAFYRSVKASRYVREGEALLAASA